MIEIVTTLKELKLYFLLKSLDKQTANKVVDNILRDHGSATNQFDYSISSVEQLANEEIPVFEKYLDYTS